MALHHSDAAHGESTGSAGLAACTIPLDSGIMKRMANTNTRHRLAAFLRRAPWLINLAYPVYQLTRARFTMGVVGVILNADNHVLLAEHVYHPRIPWGVPGGGVDGGEAPADAIMREYTEELDMRITVVRPLLVEQTYFRHVDVAFLCHSHDTPAIATKELLDAKWFSCENLPPLTAFQRRAVMCAYTQREAKPDLLQ